MRLTEHLSLVDKMSAGGPGSGPNAPCPQCGPGKGEGSEERKQIAHTTLQQLGGNRFIAMTGAKYFSFGDKGELNFKLPSGKYKAVKIEVNANDLYKVTFYKMSKKGGVPTVTGTVVRDDVDVSNLRGVFERETGLATSL